MPKPAGSDLHMQAGRGLEKIVTGFAGYPGFFPGNKTGFTQLSTGMPGR